MLYELKIKSSKCTWQCIIMFIVVYNMVNLFSWVAVISTSNNAISGNLFWEEINGLLGLLHLSKICIC